MQSVHLGFLCLSIALTVAATVPYQLDIIRGRAKPRVATWLVWSMLSAVAGTSALLDHQLAAGIYTLSCSAENMLVVVLGWRYGVHGFSRSERAGLVAAAVGVGALIVFRSPVIATMIAVATDMIGTIPTFRHAYGRPYEETLYTYILFVMSEWIILLLANYKFVTSFAYPLFFLLEDGALVTIVLFSPRWRDAPPVVVRKTVSERWLHIFKPGNPRRAATYQLLLTEALGEAIEGGDKGA